MVADKYFKNDSEFKFDPLENPTKQLDLYLDYLKTLPVTFSAPKVGFFRAMKVNDDENWGYTLDKQNDNLEKLETYL